MKRNKEGGAVKTMFLGIVFLPAILLATPFLFFWIMGSMVREAWADFREARDVGK